MNPFQGQGANMAIRDAVKVAEFFAGDVTDPKRATGAIAPANRDLVFRMANFFIRTFSKRD